MISSLEKLQAVVQRVTYHNPVTGWAVLRVQSYQYPGEQLTVTVHQTRVFAGTTMEFHGNWVDHSQYGRQFKAVEAIEKKPASTAALEKYLGSGLIKGVGPKTSRKIVAYFKETTLEIFEQDMERLLEVPGIARKKLEMIKHAWSEHRMIRDVMIFLQSHGISTLFAVRIFQGYGKQAIEIVSNDPYRLAIDFYGIGFFSADRVALRLGFAEDSEKRIRAAINHLLSSARDEGHCYLTREQLGEQLETLLKFSCGDRLDAILHIMEQEEQLKVRLLPVKKGKEIVCYYAKSLYFQELTVSNTLKSLMKSIPIDTRKTTRWVEQYCTKKELTLSQEQLQAVSEVLQYGVSVLTGGPGCGKTTTTLIIVRLLEAMGKNVLLAAPTGRAAQRMAEVIGREAKTLHRLLEWQGGGFSRNRGKPLHGDFLVVDECSMLDISLMASLLEAVPAGCQLLLIGDADQLPSVGAGNVLHDIIASKKVPVFRLNQVFRQARESEIIRFAHQINQGVFPGIQSPFQYPRIWQKKTDCMFIDSEEATKEQLSFIARVKRALSNLGPLSDTEDIKEADSHFTTEEATANAYGSDLVIPSKFHHVNIDELMQSTSGVEELKAVLKKVHPFSTLNYGMGAVDAVIRLYKEWIPKYYGRNCEVQILTPMTRGSLGTVNLNKVIQEAVNPFQESNVQLQFGDRIFREGDRVIHKRNNYDLEVFNGDIGVIRQLDAEQQGCTISFYPDMREVRYQKEDMIELDLAYAITIHKSQGSEFQVVILPLLTQHFKMLYRNLIYTGLTRGKELSVFVGSRRALGMAVTTLDTIRRQTALKCLLQSE